MSAMTHKRLRCMIGCFGGLMFAAGAIAIEPPLGGPGGPPDGERPGRPERRGPRGMMQRGPVMLAPGMIERVLDELALAPDLRKQIDEAVVEVRKSGREKMMAARPGAEEIEKARELQEEMRAAREAKDTEKMRQLREQMQEQFKARREAQEALETELHDKIKSMLPADKVEAFEQKWQEAHERGPAPPRGADNVRDLHRAVRTLQLDDTQRQEIDRIFAEFRKSHRPGGPGEGFDPEGAKQLREQIEAKLTDAQKTQLAERMERMERRQPRRFGPGGPPGEDMPPPPPDDDN